MMKPPVCIIAVQELASSAVFVSSSGKRSAMGNKPPSGIPMMNAPAHMSGWIPVQNSATASIPAISISISQNFRAGKRSISKGRRMFKKIWTVVIMLRRVPACSNVIPEEIAIGASQVIIEKNADDCKPKNSKNSHAFRVFHGDLTFFCFPFTTTESS